MLRFMCLLITLMTVSSALVAETMSDLVKIEGRYHTISGNKLFSGEVSSPDIGFFKEGLRHGDWTYFHDNGQIKNQGQYVSGRKEGVWLGYYRTGKLFYKGAYKDGKKDGPWVSYYEDETLFYQGEFRSGKEQGNWVAFNPDGTVWNYRTGFYENGVKVND